VNAKGWKNFRVQRNIAISKNSLTADLSLKIQKHYRVPAQSL